MAEHRQEVLFSLPLVGTEDFVAAKSKLEAVTRLAALTGAPPEELGPGSKERKSALVNLADGLHVDIDTRWQKPKVAQTIATVLGVPWTDSCWSAGQTITLIGLNTLLRAGEVEVRRRQAVSAVPSFVPARSKIEVVTRMATLTGAPAQDLGPGSKERKSAIANLARDLGFDLDERLSKTRFAAALADALGAAWDASCWSAGETLTLEGLNRILHGAERRLRHPAGTRFASVHEEAQALVAVLADVTPGVMDGRGCVEEMRAAGFSQWAQDEWIGLYFEFIGVPALVNAFAGGPVSFERTRFDYALSSVWDLKAHAGSRGTAPLNAIHAVDACLVSGRGLGFLVLSGTALYDDGAFRVWQREVRLAHGKRRRERLIPRRYDRRSKTSFLPERVEAFHFNDAAALSVGLETGVLGRMAQGQQVTGSPRRPKYQLALRRARLSPSHVADRVL